MFPSIVDYEHLDYGISMPMADQRCSTIIICHKYHSKSVPVDKVITGISSFLWDNGETIISPGNIVKPPHSVI